MSQVSLTYNPVEDRILLIVSNNINHPQWWLTRHMCKQLLSLLSAELSLQFELAKIQAQHSPKKTDDSLVRRHQQALQRGANRTESHKNTTNEAINALLTTQISLDKKPNNIVALYFYSQAEKGICLDLDNSGLHIFLDMLVKVAMKGEWGIKQKISAIT